MSVETVPNPFVSDPASAEKVIAKSEDPKDHPDQKLREEKILTQTGGAIGIVDFHGIDNQGRLILEKVNGVTLRDKMIELYEQNNEFSFSQIISIARSVIQSIDLLHSGHLDSHLEPIAWYDLSPNNIMIDSKLNTTIIDFGLSFFPCNPPDNFKNQIIGTDTTISPEQYFGRPDFGLEADIFCFGSLIYYLCSGGQAPFSEGYVNIRPAGENPTKKKLQEVYDAGMKKQFNNPPNPNTGHPILDVIIKVCWNLEPSKRPTSTELERDFRDL